MSIIKLAPLPAPSPDLVKTEAARRIEIVMPQWMVAREISGGKAIPASIKKTTQAIRKACDVLEATSPIPHNFTDDKYWP